jgi:hypothetical protein
LECWRTGNDNKISNPRHATKYQKTETGSRRSDPPSSIRVGLWRGKMRKSEESRRREGAESKERNDNGGCYLLACSQSLTFCLQSHAIRLLPWTVNLTPYRLDHLPPTFYPIPGANAVRLFVQSRTPKLLATRTSHPATRTSYPAPRTSHPATRTP